MSIIYTSKATLCKVNWIKTLVDLYIEYFIAGASASVQLQCYEDAISLCDKGLSVSFTACFYVLYDT